MQSIKLENSMVNDNQSSGKGQASGQSTGTQSKQQSSEISQGATSQQGSGQPSRTAQDPSYTGHYGSGGARETGYDPQRGGSQRVRGWQQPSSSALQTRGGTSASHYGGYGGPFAMMRRITDEMDRLFESFGLGRGFFPSEFGQSGRVGGYGGGEGASSLWAPHVEISERDGKLVISADLPGVKKDDVNVELNGDSITIQGHRRQESTSNERGYYHSERSYGSFYRTIPLPEGTDTENASATFRDGVLQIELQAPKQQSRGRALDIKSADEAGAGESGDQSSQRSASGSAKSGSSQSTGGSGQQR